MQFSKSFSEVFSRTLRTLVPKCSSSDQTAENSQTYSESFVNGGDEPSGTGPPVHTQLL